MALQPPVYLDNNATTPLDPRVLQEMIPVLESHFGNPASTTHAFGWHASELVKIARERVAALIGCSAEEIVFTSGATESINLALFGVAQSLKSRAGTAPAKIRFVSAATEHRATLDPLEEIGRDGADVEILPVDADGSLSDAAIADACKNGASLLSLMLANNEIGTIHPIADFSKIAAAKNVLVHCDAAQAAGKIRLDVDALGADLLSLSAHKMYGPKGVGALYVRKSRRHLLEPLHFGGGHEGGLRSGTLNVAGIVAMGKAAEIAAAELKEDSMRLRELASVFLGQLSAALGPIALNGPRLEDRLPGNLNLRFEGVDNARLIGLVQNKLAISLSSACQSASAIPSHVLRAIGLTPAQQRASIRVGIGRMNTPEEIARAANILIDAVRVCTGK